MAKLMLHVGTHKTATSWVQNAFMVNRDLLHQHGVYYPDRVVGYAHHGYIAQWVHLPDIYHVFPDTLAAWHDLADRYASRHGVVVMSSEEFSRSDHRVDFAALKPVFNRFEEVRVVGLLRDQLSYIQSIYLQISKTQQPPGWMDFLASSLRTNTCSGLFLNYHELLDFFANHFGTEAIGFASYSEASKSEGGVLGHFLRETGLSPADLPLAPVAPENANVSQNPLAVWMANVVARPDISTQPLIRAASDVLQKIAPDRSRSTIYTEQEIATATRHFARTNEGLAKRTNGRIDFTDATAFPAQTCVHRNAITSEAWVEMCRLLFLQQHSPSL
ncbi:hypothetical protein [Shimia haliotis]|uniref:Sulfotransferase domain-containing protein n=1 Tax=Shimia haliotis TaxID=1280847 RepID=A0A1I4FHL9_9RHOB|nr:hypothetical protein [Shimia haliotis]SFL16949.1 hypothetical protein SAMN04488036_10629 [Shimia haliotis]